MRPGRNSSSSQGSRRLQRPISRDGLHGHPLSRRIRLVGRVFPTWNLSATNKLLLSKKKVKNSMWKVYSSNWEILISQPWETGDAKWVCRPRNSKSWRKSSRSQSSSEAWPKWRSRWLLNWLTLPSLRSEAWPSKAFKRCAVDSDMPSPLKTRLFWSTENMATHFTSFWRAECKFGPQWQMSKWSHIWLNSKPGSCTAIRLNKSPSNSHWVRSRSTVSLV